ncbi:hypothetical protein ACU61A_15895 [Pseudonocardia sichuanensis]
MTSQVLHWSREWADLVGGDGPIITDLLGRLAPALTDEQARQIKKADFARYGTVHSSLDYANRRAWEIADRNGLRTALACARQTVDRVIDTIAPHNPASGTNDRWHLWSYPRRALDGVITALVIRRAAPADLVDEFAALWCDIHGPLPESAELDTGVPAHDRCPECGQTRGVRVVTEAEAARYARHLQAGQAHALEWAQEDAARARRQLAEFARQHMSRDAVRELVRQELNDTPGLSAKARAHLHQRFGIADGPDAEEPLPLPAGSAQ